MEETTYVRHTGGAAVSSPTNSDQDDQEKSQEGAAVVSETTSAGHSTYKKKSYIKKLSLVAPPQPGKNLVRRLYQTLYYLSWPVIFYAGYVIYTTD